MQDSGDTGAKAAGETQKPLLRLGGQAGLSLFCALAQFRLIMFILGPTNYRRSVDAALGVVTGHPHWRITQSRLLGPWLVQAMTPLFGSYLWAHVFFSVLALTAAGLLAWRIGGLRGFLALQLGFAALLSTPWLFAWDYLDLIVFLAFVLFVKDRRPWPWFVVLYVVAILNRDSAQFIALWLVIEGALRRQWRPMVAGAALIAAGMVLLEFVRHALLVQEMGPKLFLDAPRNPANAVFGWQLSNNLNWLRHAIVAPDLAAPFLVPLFLLVSFGASVLLIRRGTVALGLTFAAMTAAVPMFAVVQETRAMVYLIPALVALCYAETGPPLAWPWRWLGRINSSGATTKDTNHTKGQPTKPPSQSVAPPPGAGWPAEKHLALFALALAATTLAVYWPALGGAFIWDDDIWIKNNPYVKSPSGLFDIWCSTRLPDFFPLTSTSFWLEWRLWGMRAGGYHLTNVLLHAASAVILWRVLRRLAVPAAWLAALLFAVHPVNVESVAWITERKNTLAMVFYLLSLLLYLRFDQSSRNTQHAPRFYLLSLAAFLLALLAKTSVVMMPFVLLGCAWWQRGRIERRDVLRAVPFFWLSLALGLVTIWFQHYRAIGGEVVQSGSFWARLAGAGWAVWFYLGKTLWPWRLSFVYPRWEIDAHSLLAYLPTAALVLGAAVLWHYRRAWGRGALFGLGYFVVMLAPVLGFVNIYFQRYSLVADHWQYYSIIGVIALVVGAASRLSREGFRAWPLRLAAGAVVVVLSVASWRQAGLYESPLVLWQDTLAKNPGCWMAHNNLGLFLANNADAAGPSALDQAMTHYKESLRLKPDQVEARINLGSALMKLGRLDDAKAQFEAGAKADPANGMVFYNLGLVLEEQGKPAEAQANYRRAIQAWPDYAEPHNNLGAALQLQGDLPAAQAEFAQAVRLQPGLARARSNLGLVLQAQGKTAAALDQFRQALRLEPDYAEAHNNLGKVLAEQGNLAGAKAEFAEAARLKSGYADAQFNLGNTLLMLGQPADAVAPYTAALQARTNFPEAHLALGQVSAALGRTNEAVQHFVEALRLKPFYAEAHYQWGSLLLSQGRADQAQRHFMAALQCRPDYPEAHYQLGTLLANQKQTDPAIAHLQIGAAIAQFREAVRLKPDWLEALNNLAWLLATQPDAKLRNAPEALRLAAHAVELTRTNHPGPLDTLAAAYAAAGRFPEAAAAAQKAFELATAAGQKPLAAEIQKRRQAYAAGQPFRE